MALKVWNNGKLLTKNMNNFARKRTIYGSYIHRNYCESRSNVKSLDFSFGGAGFLISYQLGIAQGLRDIGALDSNSRVAGASSGAIVALSALLNIDFKYIHEETKKLAASSGKSGTWTLQAKLRDLVLNEFSEDMDVALFNKRLTVATYRVWPLPFKTVYNTSFESSADICDTVLASCHIPYYLAPKHSAFFHNEWHVDGCFGEFIPNIPNYIKVSALPSYTNNIGGTIISPSILPNFPYSAGQLVYLALKPPTPEHLDKLFELGQMSALKWRELRTKESKISNLG